MARPTRQRRRERREQQRAEGAPAAERTRARQQQVRPAAEPEAEVPRRRRGGTFNFILECWGELRKVEWPGQKQVITGTVVVIIACLIVGGYLWAVDLGLEPFVERLLLGK